MIRAFTAALEDDDILVRRAMLDLLEQTFPVDSPAFKRYTLSILYAYYLVSTHHDAELHPKTNPF
jgi:hypothetical protein